MVDHATVGCLPICFGAQAQLNAKIKYSNKPGYSTDSTARPEERDGGKAIYTNSYGRNPSAGRHYSERGRGSGPRTGVARCPVGLEKRWKSYSGEGATGAQGGGGNEEGYNSREWGMLAGGSGRYYETVRLREIRQVVRGAYYGRIRGQERELGKQTKERRGG